MAERWKRRIVTTKHVETGRWQVIDTDRGWALVEPLEETSRNLANLSPDGVVWFRTQDLMTASDPNQGVLL